MEIVVRALVIFVFLWAITRLVGRSTLGELSTFELLLFVTMGDLVQQAVTGQDYSIVGGFLAIGTFAILTIALSYLKWRWPRRLAFISGNPIVILRHGEPELKAMGRERLSMEDLATAARQQGIRRLSDIEIAVLETDGRISFFTNDTDSGAPKTTPPETG